MPFLHDHNKPEQLWKQWEKKTLKNGLRHAIFNNGDRYIGEWKNNLKNGRGFCLTQKGELYEGDWKNKYRHGFGTLATIQPDKTFVLNYLGEWKFGKPDGEGTRHYDNGSLYIGHWKNGKRHGYGRLWFNNGSYYDGMWENDYSHGMGMLVQQNGNRYEGLFKNGFKHGCGRFYHLDSGQLQEGMWVRNIAKCTTMNDIPYRQTALYPTQFPIKDNYLRFSKEVLVKRKMSILVENVDVELLYFNCT